MKFFANTIKNWKKRISVDRTKWEPRPLSAWRSIVWLFIILVIIAFALHYYLYFSWQKENEAQEETALFSAKFDQVGLKKTLVEFNERAIKFEKYFNQQPPVVDPSR